jgi:hypothetical protein
MSESADDLTLRKEATVVLRVPSQNSLKGSGVDTLQCEELIDDGSELALVAIRCKRVAHRERTVSGAGERFI